MSKFAIGEKVDTAADEHEGGTVIAIFPTVDGSFRYAVDMEGYGALQFFPEEKPVAQPLLVRYRKWHGSRLARLLGARDRARLRRLALNWAVCTRRRS